ncbi:MAG: penicillin-binding protein 2 [Candidatus Margulisiibacteriota bacterium]
MKEGKRFRLLFGLFLVILGVILLRLVWLQIIQHRFFLERSQEQRTRIINLAANRGDILDSRGQILATSIDTFSIFKQKHGFAWIARRLPLAEAEKVKASAPDDYIVVKEKKRIYPKNRLAAQLIGFVGSENQGLSGVELAWDKYLKGKEGRVVTEGDPEGRELYGALRTIDPGEDGMNVTLTIDENLQYAAERDLTEQVRLMRAQSGMLIVMDVKSGEILALASKPDFDPNEYKKADRRLWHPRFLDPYEPGSTFKLITAAAGLEERVISPASRLKALNRLEIGGKVIENSHQIKWTGPDMSLAMMLEQSINTGAAQIGIKMGPEKFYNRLKQFGFGRVTDFGLDGESRGIVRRWDNWYKPDVAMISFGQSIAVTPLQLLSAVAAFANHGRVVKPFVIKRIASNDGQFIKVFSREERGRPVSEATAKEMLKLMFCVVMNGSGRRAQLADFKAGGKTGTAQKAAPGGRGYLKGHFIASFIGVAPLTDPNLIALVILDDPQTTIWGESAAGPLFKSVVSYALRYLNVKPDNAIIPSESNEQKKSSIGYPTDG